MKILMLIVLPLGLTACAASTPSIKQLHVDAPPASLVQPCRSPVGIPERQLTQADVENYWLRDRRSLVDCRSRHNGLAGWAQETIQTLEGEKK